MNDTTTTPHPSPSLGLMFCQGPFEHCAEEPEGWREEVVHVQWSRVPCPSNQRATFLKRALSCGVPILSIFLSFLCLCRFVDAVVTHSCVPCGGRSLFCPSMSTETRRMLCPSPLAKKGKNWAKGLLRNKQGYTLLLFSRHSCWTGMRYD